MKRTELLQGIRTMKFEDIYERTAARELSQVEAADILGVSERTFRRWRDRYEAEGAEGLYDRRLGRISARRVPVDTVMEVVGLFETRYHDFTTKHFHEKLKSDHQFTRSYNGVRLTLQSRGLVKKAPRRGAHRRKRERRPLPDMMLHQDGSSHQWVAGKWWDLIVTMDDATSEIYSAIFVEEEGTMSTFSGIEEVISERGLFCSLYTDRGSYYWHTPEAGGKVDKNNPTQLGRALHQLGIELMEEANRFLKRVYLPQHNANFAIKPTEPGSAFVPFAGNLKDTLCVQEERVVGNDNTVRYKNLVLQIPEDKHRHHYVKARVRVHQYPDQTLAIFYGPRKLATFDQNGEATDDKNQLAA